MAEQEEVLRYCNQCLDEAISETENGVITEVNLEEVTKSAKACVRCGHAYCVDHASPVDLQNQCLRCLPLESIEIKTEPLVDEEGVTKRGRRLIPVGPNYRTLPRAISLMTDSELEDFIKTTGELVHATEKIQEYRRIGLSTARLEKADREDAKLREARAFQAALPRSQKISITGQKGKGTKSNFASDFAAFIKFAKEQLDKKKAAAKSGAPPASTVGASGVQSPPIESSGEAPDKDSNEKKIEDLFGDDK